MDTTIIEATKCTPLITLNPNGEIILQGRSIIEDTIAFYKPVMDWIVNVDSREMTVVVRMEYMNTSSSKQLLYMLKAVVANPFIRNIYVKWYYEEDDEDMLDMGKDYESILHIPFDFFELSAEVA